MTTTILDAVLKVFDSIATWFAEVMPVVLAIFYADGQLTILGVLAVAGLAISVIFLIMGVIQNFLHFRGQHPTLTSKPFQGGVGVLAFARFPLNTG